MADLTSDDDDDETRGLYRQIPPGPERCPSLSPEEYRQCALPDTRRAHIAGHQTETVNGRRSSWGTRIADVERWKGTW